MIAGFSRLLRACGCGAKRQRRFDCGFRWRAKPVDCGLVV